MQAADMFGEGGDAKAGVEAISQELHRRGVKNVGYRLHRERIANTPIHAAEFAIAPGTFGSARNCVIRGASPRRHRSVPGLRLRHQGYFQTHMRGRRPENFHVIAPNSRITW